MDFGGGDGATIKPKKVNRAPITKAGPVDIKVKLRSGMACAISLEVLADDIDSTADSDGETGISWKTYDLKAPVPVYDMSSGLAIVSKVTTAPQASGALVIRTVYKKKHLENVLSGYGRGTTADDRKAGNVSLGFHESCHREDYITYLKTQALPDFDINQETGAVGDEFNSHWEDFKTAFAALPKSIGEWSRKRTDDVGVTKATWDAKHSKKTPGAAKH